MTSEKIAGMICDTICKYPDKCGSQEQLDEICETCPVNELTDHNGDLISRAELDRLLVVAQDNDYITMDEYDLFCELVGQVPSAEAEVKCIARINVDVEEVVRRIKEEYEITDGWIPCSERLPSESGRYLVTYLVLQRHIWVDVIHFGKPSMPNKKFKGMCWYVADDEWGDVVYDDILAWMPLPKPYEGDGEKE